MRVIVQMRFSLQLASAAAAGGSTSAGAHEQLPGFTVDPEFGTVQVPSPIPPQPGANAFAFSQPIRFTSSNEEATYLVRGEIPEHQLSTVHAGLPPDVVGVFADPVIESTLTCGGDPAVGNANDVAAALAAGQLAAAGMDGTNVALAIVDTGINLAWLKTQGRTPKVDAARSWTPAGVKTKPGNHPKNHGTMCAFDAGIVAPKATVLDHAVLLSQKQGATTMEGLLSDAVLSYSKLLQVVGAMPVTTRALVVSNSWGMFSPTWDFPVGNPGNYSDNPSHPFNVIVASLAAAGADILFAAGNCGLDCPDGRCQFGNTRPICGANSHPSVLCIAGIDIHKSRVGYSSQGPGRLSARKPDVACYTHFDGSHVYAPSPDSGTSAATPVAAGVVAAIRTRYSAGKVPPDQLRSIIAKTSLDLEQPGFDYDTGWGALDPGALIAALAKV
jgi:subtilisin family serine protease